MQKPEDTAPTETAELARAWLDVAERSRTLIAGFLARQKVDPNRPVRLDPFNATGAMFEAAARLWSDPSKLIEAQLSLWQGYTQLWHATAARLRGEQVAPVASPAPGDKRFKDAEWSESAVFDYIKQSYLLTAAWLQRTMPQAEGLDEATRRKVEFHTRQLVDAMAPSNFVLTNPEVLRTTIATKGENLVKGLDNLLQDLERGKGELLVRMTDLDAFEIGRNIAVTPGKVVFENELMQLIQYAPSTGEVRRRPLLIIPPWINKFYILDLKAQNSFVKWAVDQGHTVFMISWVNPDATLAAKSFEDYIHDGLFDALTAIERATGERRVNAIGYCLGGTMLASALAIMAARGDDRVASATYFVAMVDFRDVGDVAVFIDDNQLSAMEEEMARQGYLDAASLHKTFNLLRANDLIWSFVVQNYLLGKEPFPFDLLYWNSDSTRLPAAMHAWYLRNCYQKNLLREPGALTLDGVPIDLRRVTTPSIVVAAREDHIAPWKTVYAGAPLYSGATRFVLAASGHIAGIVNPPAAKKYGYWTNEALPAEPDTWLAGATQHDGSWWSYWDDWVRDHADGMVPARDPGAGGLAAIEDAPGRYVCERAI
jgi:polyhydroxyalkanoate synthase subunit PhaC